MMEVETCEFVSLFSHVLALFALSFNTAITAQLHAANQIPLIFSLALAFFFLLLLFRFWIH